MAADPFVVVQATLQEVSRMLLHDLRYSGERAREMDPHRVLHRVAVPCCDCGDNVLMMPDHLGDLARIGQVQAAQAVDMSRTVGDQLP